VEESHVRILPFSKECMIMEYLVGQQAVSSSGEMQRIASPAHLAMMDIEMLRTYTLHRLGPFAATARDLGTAARILITRLPARRCSSCTGSFNRRRSMFAGLSSAGWRRPQCGRYSTMARFSAYGASRRPRVWVSF
jgi:hypothetical protein